jgi:nucleotide-binding universal stress UspA family protein
MNRIIVPVDFSGPEGEALAYAVPLAKSTGAIIVLLHVIEPLYAGPDPGLALIPQRTGRRKKQPRK